MYFFYKTKIFSETNDCLLMIDGRWVMILI